MAETGNLPNILLHLIVFLCRESLKPINSHNTSLWIFKILSWGKYISCNIFKSSIFKWRFTHTHTWPPPHPCYSISHAASAHTLVFFTPSCPVHPFYHSQPFSSSATALSWSASPTLAHACVKTWRHYRPGCADEGECLCFVFLGCPGISHWFSISCSSVLQCILCFWLQYHASGIWARRRHLKQTIAWFPSFRCL